MKLKSFLEHFDDLRSVILRFFTVWGILFGATYFFLSYIEKYLYELVPNLVYLRIYEPILLRFTLMAWISTILIVPYLICEISYYLKDLFKVNFIMIIALAFVYSGSVFVALTLVLPKISSMLIALGSNNISFYFSALNYAQFAGSVVLLSSLLSILPFVIIGLGFHKLFDNQSLTEKRVYFIVLSFIIAAIITPPDIISQIVVALLIYFFYELIIILNRYQYLHK